ncbi:PKD domain-containing protein [Maribacter sp. 2-571]|uniref:PKD domain-containing protein n=1 Tax=Maribacter sp. 2-571 TaxID=3417569 RepID=UPI003D3525EA
MAHSFMNGQGSITMPIEVLGQEGVAEKIDFLLEEPAKGSVLYLRCNNLSYDGKASYNLNGNGWVDFEDAHVIGKGAVYGGIDGGHHTIDLQIPVAPASLDTNNVIRFRFNFSDGISIGYRVLAFNILDSSGTALIPAETFIDANPNLDPIELPMDAATIAAGKNLWETAELWNSYKPDAKVIKAKCASCHASDGRDMKYFNYSNKSIIERSKFHKLTQEEGEQIASYIRSLDVPAPEQARPWNPPYQPGPGLDEKPVEEWAAGAGLDAVLENDEDMLPYLFPKGTSEDEIEKALGIKSTLNIRELPVAIQFPDWKHWLPEVHPVDIWGELFEESYGYRAYSTLLEALETDGPDVLLANGTLLELLNRFNTDTHSFVGVRGPQPCKNNGTANSVGGLNGAPGYDCEDKSLAVMHWLAVKLWDIMQTYGLENISDQAYTYGEKYSWIGSNSSVFDLAPHRSANNSFNFKDQDRLVGAYTNTAWYQLELILNPVHRSPQNHKPIDWKYQMDHLYYNTRESGEMHSLRYLTTVAKMWQNLDMTGPDGLGDDNGPNKEGWWLHHVHPRRLYSAHGSFLAGNEALRREMLAHLDNIDYDLRRKVTKVLLADFVDKTLSYDPEEFPRETAEGPHQNTIDPKDYVPVDYDPNKGELFFDGGKVADQFYRLIPRLKNEVRLEPETVNRMVDWCKVMWPNGDWDQFKMDELQNQLPLPDITVVGDSLQINKEIVFSAEQSTDPDGTIVSYEWDMGDGVQYAETISAHIYSETGLYKVNLKVTDDDGETSGTSSFILILPEDFFDNDNEPESEATDMFIYPNPFNGGTLFISSSSDIYGAQIYSMEGKLMTNINLSGKPAEFSAPQLSAGIYLLKLQYLDDDTKTVTQKSLKIIVN